MRFDNAEVPTLPIDVPDHVHVAPGVPLTVSPDEAARAVAAANLALRNDWVAAGTADMWEGSPFAWLRSLPTARRSLAGVGLCEMLLRGAGFDPRPKSSHGHDRMVNGFSVKVKFSTLWASGTYTFQQVPVDGFDVMVLLGVHPRGVHAWMVTKRTLVDALRAASQSELGLLVDPDAPEAWLGSGGSPEEFFARAPVLLGDPSEPHGPAALRPANGS